MTREIANWFHEREGELFTQDEIPFDRDELVQVIDDSVDPIQQVAVDESRYYGVISYDEHDGWYEYTRWDDAIGEVNMGVCAQCVNKADSVAQVARTVGVNTDEARAKFEQHYEQEHTVTPDEIETGATLLSGTTINGNQAIHPGMDGAGSGVDADFVRGGSPVEKGQAVGVTKTVAGKIQSSFPSPSGFPQGVGTDSNNCIWHVEDFTASVYKFNKSGTEQSKFATPCNTPKGVEIDSNACVWLAQAPTNSEKVHQINQSGTIQSTFESPSSNPQGVGVDSGDCIWLSERSDQSIYEFNQGGTIQSQFANPSDRPYGVCFDSNDSMFLVEVNAQCIYKITQNGTVERKFSTPQSGYAPAKGIGYAVDDGSLWYADNGPDSVFELTKGSNELKIN